MRDETSEPEADDTEGHELRTPVSRNPGESGPMATDEDDAAGHLQTQGTTHTDIDEEDRVED